MPSLSPKPYALHALTPNYPEPLYHYRFSLQLDTVYDPEPQTLAAADPEPQTLVAGDPETLTPCSLVACDPGWRPSPLNPCTLADCDAGRLDQQSRPP